MKMIRANKKNWSVEVRPSGYVFRYCKNGRIYCKPLHTKNLKEAKKKISSIIHEETKKMIRERNEAMKKALKRKGLAPKWSLVKHSDGYWLNAEINGRILPFKLDMKSKKMAELFSLGLVPPRKEAA